MTLTWEALSEGERDDLAQHLALVLHEHDTSRLVCVDHDGLCCPHPGCQHGMTGNDDKVHLAATMAQSTTRMMARFEHGHADTPARDIEPAPEPVTLPDGTAVNALLYAMRNCGDHVETVSTALIVDPQETAAALLTRMYGLDSPNPYGYPNDPRDSRVELRLAVTDWPLPRPQQQPADTAESPF